MGAQSSSAGKGTGDCVKQRVLDYVSCKGSGLDVRWVRVGCLGYYVVRETHSQPTIPWEEKRVPISYGVAGIMHNGETLQISTTRSKIPPLGAFHRGKKKKHLNGNFQIMRLLEDITQEQDSEFSLLLRSWNRKESVASTCGLVLSHPQ